MLPRSTPQRSIASRNVLEVDGPHHALRSAGRCLTRGSPWNTGDTRATGYSIPCRRLSGPLGQDASSSAIVTLSAHGRRGALAHRGSLWADRHSSMDWLPIALSMAGTGFLLIATAVYLIPPFPVARAATREPPHHTFEGHFFRITGLRNPPASQQSS